MLLTIALAASIALTPTNEMQVVRRGTMTYDSQPMNPHTEQVPDPADPTKTVTAKVSHFIKFRIHLEDEPDDYVVSRVVRTRPEQPARPFQMSEMRVSIERNLDNRDAIRGLSQTLDAEKVPASNVGLFNRALQAMRGLAIEEIDTTPETIDPNVGIKGGGWTERAYGYDIYYTDLHMQVVKKIEIEGRLPVEQNVGREQVFDLWEYWIPVPMIRERFIPDPIGSPSHSMNMSLPDGFGGIKFTDQYAGLLGRPYVTLPRINTEIRYLTGGQSVTTNANRYQDQVFATMPGTRDAILDVIKLTPRTITNMLNGAAAQGEDMNALNMPGDPDMMGDPMCGSEMYMPYGTLWIPDKPGYQVMMNTTPMRYQFAADASLEGAPSFASARTHCLNKSLKMPEAGVRYFPYMSNDEILTQLAEMTNASNFRGPWDQVRTWIYTDKISLADAHEALDFPVSESQYASGLFDVFKLGGFDAKDLLNKKLFTPDLLSSATLTDKAFDWLSMRVGEIAGKEVRKWIEGMPPQIAKMLKTPANDFEKKHAPRLFRNLLESLDKDTRMGALTYLDKSKDTDAALKDQLGDFRASIYSDDKAEADLAKKVAPRFVSEIDADIALMLRR